MPPATTTPRILEEPPRAPAAPRPTATTLQTSPLLKELPDETLSILAAVASWETFKPGNIIIRQNDRTDSVFFVVSGYAKVMRGGTHSEVRATAEESERRVRSRHQVMVALLGPGDLAGEITPLLDIPRTASLLALTPCDVISLPGDAFLAALERHPGFALAVMRRMAEHLVQADRQIELMRGDLQGRIHALLRTGKAMGLDTERWLTNAEIARMVGATRVAVSQAMGRDDGLRPRRASAKTAPRT